MFAGSSEDSRALEAAEDKLFEEDRDFTENSPGQRRADALGVVAEAALASGLDTGARGDRYQVVVHVDRPVLEEGEGEGECALEGGKDVSPETSRRLACDGSTVVMTYGGDGRVLDVGRKTRVVPAAIRRALKGRDKVCRFPGCGLKFCDAHHLDHWANGGETKLENLTLLCRHHHRAVHELGFRVERLPGGELQFYGPDGAPLHPAPPVPVQEKDPADILRQEHLKEGLDIDPWTTTPEWDGEPMDLDWVMGAVWQPRPRTGERATRGNRNEWPAKDKGVWTSVVELRK